MHVVVYVCAFMGGGGWGNDTSGREAQEVNSEWQLVNASQHHCNCFEYFPLQNVHKHKHKHFNNITCYFWSSIYRFKEALKGHKSLKKHFDP